MKLPISNSFTLENPVTEETYTGSLIDLSNGTQKKLRKKFKGSDNETIYKDAIERRVISKDKDKIINAGKQYGYELVFKTILLDVVETTNAKKKDLTSGHIKPGQEETTLRSRPETERL